MKKELKEKLKKASLKGKKKAKKKKVVTNPFYGNRFEEVLGEAVKPLASK
jgi:hypothetical protein